MMWKLPVLLSAQAPTAAAVSSKASCVGRSWLTRCQTSWKGNLTHHFWEKLCLSEEMLELNYSCHDIWFSFHCHGDKNVTAISTGNLNLKKKSVNVHLMHVLPLCWWINLTRCNFTATRSVEKLKSWWCWHKTSQFHQTPVFDDNKAFWF